MPQIDPFAGRARGENAPFENCLIVTPGDDPLPVIPSAIMPVPSTTLEGSAKRLTVEFQNGTQAEISCPHPAQVGWSGALIPLKVKRILASSIADTQVMIFW